MKLIAILFLFKAIISPQVINQEQLEKALEINKACANAFGPLRSLGQSDDFLFKGFVAALDNFGQVEITGDFKQRLSAYILKPLSEIYAAEKLEDPAQLQDKFVAGVTSILGDGKAGVNKGALESLATSLFLSHFFSKVCHADKFNFDFLNAADQIVQKVGPSSGDVDRFSEDYNDFKRFAKDQLAELVNDQTDFICGCRGLNGLIQLSRILHRSLYFLAKNAVSAEQINLAAKRYMDALMLLHENVPKSSLKVSYLKEHFSGVSSRLLVALEHQAGGQPLDKNYEVLIREILKRIYDAMKANGEKTEADSSLIDLFRSIFADYFTFDQPIDSFTPYIHAYLAVKPDLSLPDKTDLKAFRLGQLKIFELFAAELEPTQTQMEAVTSRLTDLLDIDLQLLYSWSAGFNLHSSQYYTFNEQIKSELVVKGHDVVNEFIVTRLPSSEQDKFAEQFDEFTDQLYLETDKAEIAFFLKLVNGLSQFGILPETSYELNFPVNQQTQQYGDKLKDEWDLGGVIPMAEDQARATQKLPASFFAQFMKVEDAESQQRGGQHEVQFNDVNHLGFKKAEVGGDLNEVKIDQPQEYLVTVNNVNSDCVSSPSEKKVIARPSENIPLVEYQVNGQKQDKTKYDEVIDDCLHPRIVAFTVKILQPDCTIKSKDGSRKALNKQEPLEQTLFAIHTAPDNLISKTEFDQKLAECHEATKVITYQYIHKKLIDCEFSSLPEELTKKPASVDELTTYLIQFGNEVRQSNEIDFETELRNCYKLKNTKVTRNSLNVLYGKLVEERVRAIRDSPDMLAYFTSQAPTEEIVNGVPVEFAYVLINRNGSPCEKRDLF